MTSPDFLTVVTPLQLKEEGVQLKIVPITGRGTTTVTTLGDIVYANGRSIKIGGTTGKNTSEIRGYVGPASPVLIGTVTATSNSNFSLEVCHITVECWEPDPCLCVGTHSQVRYPTGVLSKVRVGFAIRGKPWVVLRLTGLPNGVKDWGLQDYAHR